LASSLALVSILSAQESVPAGEVRDSMTEPSEVAPSSIPESSPRVSDIDRLFDSPGEVEAADEAAENRASAPQIEGLASSLSEEMVLESSELTTVNYPNEEIRTVLRNVADLYSLNIVIPETLVGATSIKLRDVSWKQIFNVVLDPVGYTYVEEGSIIKVVSRDSLNFEPPTTEIFMINYAEASEISATVSNLVSAEAGGAVQVDKRSNALIVSERASKMESIREVIARLDQPTQQIFIETRFIEVVNSDVKNIGVNWSSLRNYSVGVGNINRSWGDSRTRDRTTTDGFDKQQSTNVEDVSISNQADVDGLGVTRGRFIDNLNNQTIMDSTAIGENTLISDAVSNLYSLVNTNGLTRTSSAVFTADQFGFVISALKEQGGSRLVSNPTVVTLNNQEAMISVGEQFPIPSYQYNEETGGFEVSGFDFRDIGIILKVTPSVNHSGLISMKVEPEVSSRTGAVTFGGASGAAIPIIATRRTVTQIALKDGFTMGIGGLMESSGAKDKQQVPVLGKVPGLGRLFRHESKNDQKRNLLIFITARILPSEAADFEDVFSEEMMDAAGVDPVELKNR